MDDRYEERETTTTVELLGRDYELVIQYDYHEWSEPHTMGNKTVYEQPFEILFRGYFIDGVQHNWEQLCDFVGGSTKAFKIVNEATTPH